MRRITPTFLAIALLVAFAWSSPPLLATVKGAASLKPANLPNTSIGCTTLFSAVSSPNNVVATNELESVAPISPTDIWSVGFWNSGAGNAPDQTMSEHWNGSSWTIVATPNLGNGFNDLYGVAANDSNDVWAVGSWQNNSVGYTLALHWNGSSWSSVTTPQPSASYQFLGGVSAIASNDMWAVGAYVNGAGLFQTLALHWNGGSWSAIATPDAGSGDNHLGGVFMRASNDVWAVGDFRASPGAANPRSTLIEHWDGSSWTIATSPNPVTGDNVLLSVSATSATDVWAAGYTTSATPLVQTLTEHLVAGVWTTVASPNIASGDNALSGIVAVSATNAWAVGSGRTDNLAASPSTLTEHWDGSAWTIQTSSGSGSNGNSLFGVAALPGNNVYAVGGAVDVNSHEQTLVMQFQLPAPSGVTAVAADQSASISWTAPACDGGFTTTGWVVTASDGCTVQASMALSSATPLSTTFTGLTNGSAFNFTVQAVSASLGAETPSAPSTAVIPTGPTVPVVLTACSARQYQYPNPDPTTFVDMDATNLILTVTPSADSFAVISANADLWTATTGVNQDIGINVNGTVVGWKESGGLAGTFSPNAAALQAVVPMTSGTPYTVKLQWKSNRALAGATIFAGAGPLPGVGQTFSPTRLSMRLVPASANTLQTVSTNKQYALAANDGNTFVDMDGTGLSTQVTPASDSMAVITANADLWTAKAGFNQDIAINVDGTVVGWKESGGFAGVFSPNAAFVQVVVPLTVTGSPHTIKLQWKGQQAVAAGTIFAGAGPWPSGGTTYSPTRLTVALLSSSNVASGVNTNQYKLANSDGAGWTPVDTTLLKLNLSPAAGAYSYSLTGNADLWTANAGFNQDIGLFISGGVYGSGTLVAWKESGGFAGTFSPNAAYVETIQHLSGGVSYSVWLAWKANTQGAGATIFAAAGPLHGTTSFSPSRLTASLLSSP